MRGWITAGYARGEAPPEPLLRGRPRLLPAPRLRGGGALRPRPLTPDARDTEGFVATKKAIALALVGVFAWLAGRALLGLQGEFFESFYSVLVLADILVVLVSLRYSPSYLVMFRNSGLAVAAVLLRVALSAPPYANAALGLAAALFTLGLTVASTRLAPLLLQRAERAAPEVALARTEPGR